MNGKLLLVGCLALFACSDQRTDSTCKCAPSFASAELPTIGGGEDPAQELWIEITADGRTTVNGVALGATAELLPRAIAALKQNPQLRAWISADDGVSYGALLVVMDLLRQATISRMAFGSLSAPQDERW